MIMEKEVINQTVLGRLLISGAFLNEEQLNCVIEKQRSVNKKLGELLLEENLIDKNELELALHLQKELRDPKTAIKLSAGIRKRLGEILLEAKKITEKQLTEALTIQEKTKEKLGEILVRLGYLKRSDINIALLFQENSNVPLSNSLRLGQILEKSKIINESQLNEALAIQKQNPDKKLGEILVELGYINKSDLEFGLKIQKKLIKAALVGVFALSEIINVGFLEAAEKEPQTKSSSSAKVMVTAHVKGYVKLNKVDRIKFLKITQDDIEKGFLQVDNAAFLNIKSNYPSVFLNVEKVADGFFDTCIVEINNQQMELGREGGIFYIKMNEREATSVLNFKFKLKNGVEPGDYRFPFLISVSGI